MRPIPFVSALAPRTRRPRRHSRLPSVRAGVPMTLLPPGGPMTFRALFAVAALSLAACQSDAEFARHRHRDTPPESGLEQIKTIVVIYDENRSFDNLYGLFPGANGVRNAAPDVSVQRDAEGDVLTRLPSVWTGKPPSADPKYRSDLANRPFRIDTDEGHG